MKKQRDINSEIKEMLKNYNLQKEIKNKDGTDKAFKDIMDLTKPLILYSINQMVYKPPITKEDLEEVCWIRLWEIIDKYKESETILFSNYLVRDLKFTMINYIRNEQNMITIPHNIIETNAKINKAKAENKDLSEFTEKQLENYEKTAVINEKGTWDIDLVDEHNDIEDFVENLGWNNEKIAKIYEELSDDEREMLDAIVINELSYAEYGRRIGRTREAIRVRFNKLQEKIRKELKK